MLAPWRPFGQDQHLIVWVDLAEAREDDEIGNAVRERVSQVLPGVTLLEVVRS